MTAVVRAAIVACLNGVPDIGRVHAYERYGKTNKEMADLYAVDSVIRGWFVRRVAVREIGGTQASGMEIAEWRIVGLRALQDADQSELVLDMQVDTVRAAFRADETLGGTVFGLLDASGEAASPESGLQVPSIEPVMFAGVLCHRAMCRLVTSRYIPY